MRLEQGFYLDPTYFPGSKELWPSKKRDATKRPQLGYQSRYPGVKKGKNVGSLSLEGDSEVSRDIQNSRLSEQHGGILSVSKHI